MGKSAITQQMVLQWNSEDSKNLKNAKILQIIATVNRFNYRNTKII